MHILGSYSFEKHNILNVFLFQIVIIFKYNIQISEMDIFYSTFSQLLFNCIGGVSSSLRLLLCSVYVCDKLMFAYQMYPTKDIAFWPVLLRPNYLCNYVFLIYIPLKKNGRANSKLGSLKLDT